MPFCQLIQTNILSQTFSNTHQCVCVCVCMRVSVCVSALNKIILFKCDDTLGQN